MGKYVFQWRYSSGIARGEAGEVIECDDDFAAMLNVDSPGVLVPYVEPEPEPKAREVAEPPADRQVKTSATRKAKP